MRLPESDHSVRGFIDQWGHSLSKPSYPPNATWSFSDGVQEACVRHYASGLASSRDGATAIAVDDSGNVYVTGYSTNLAFGVDYFTAKYNAAGTQVWTARYSGTANGDDLASAICVDASGNVYVTGMSWGSGVYYDYATIKYNSAGAEQWVARFDGPGNFWDGATAVDVDTQGNVYVTGWSRSSRIDYDNSDYVTIKYSSSGIDQICSDPCFGQRGRTKHTEELYSIMQKPMEETPLPSPSPACRLAVTASRWCGSTSECLPKAFRRLVF